MAHSLLERFRSTNGLKVVIYFCKINTYSISAPTLFFFFFLSFYGGGGGWGAGVQAEEDGKVEEAFCWCPPSAARAALAPQLGSVNARFIFFC